MANIHRIGDLPRDNGASQNNLRDRDRDADAPAEMGYTSDMIRRCE
jgi:hypothetical protein